MKLITKVKASAKVYNRKKQNSQGYGYSFGGSAFLGGWRRLEGVALAESTYPNIEKFDFALTM